MQSREHLYQKIYSISSQFFSRRHEAFVLVVAFGWLLDFSPEALVGSLLAGSA
jgi:hypothetical protein